MEFSCWCTRSYVRISALKQNCIGIISSSNTLSFNFSIIFLIASTFAVTCSSLLMQVLIPKISTTLKERNCFSLGGKRSFSQIQFQYFFPQGRQALWRISMPIKFPVSVVILNVFLFIFRFPEVVHEFLRGELASRKATAVVMQFCDMMLPG